MSYRAFWQRRCRAAAAEAVLKPLGGNCAVLPYVQNDKLPALVDPPICAGSFFAQKSSSVSRKQRKIKTSKKMPVLSDCCYACSAKILHQNTGIDWIFMAMACIINSEELLQSIVPINSTMLCGQNVEIHLQGESFCGRKCPGKSQRYHCGGGGFPPNGIR